MRQKLFTVTPMLFLFCMASCSEPEPAVTPPSEIEYRGELYQLTKSHDDYDDYVDDVQNLDPSENERVARAVATAPVPATAASIPEIVRSVMYDVKFPGYGAGTLLPKDKADPGKLVGMQVEIPRTERIRILVYELRDGTFHLVQDIQADREPMVTAFEVDSDKINYFGRDELLFSQPIE